MSDQPDDVHLAQMAATIAAGLVEGTLSDLVRADDASRNVVADLSIDLAQRIVRRLTTESTSELLATAEAFSACVDRPGGEWTRSQIDGLRRLRVAIQQAKESR